MGIFMFRIWWRDVVLVIAIDCLNEDEYHVLEVPGLTYSANPIEIGYIAFCKSRCCNSQFYGWFIENIVINTIKTSKEIKKVQL